MITATVRYEPRLMDEADKPEGGWSHIELEKDDGVDGAGYHRRCSYEAALKDGLAALARDADICGDRVEDKPTLNRFYIAEIITIPRFPNQVEIDDAIENNAKTNME